MEEEMSERENGGLPHQGNYRRHARQALLKSAKISFGSSEVDCILLDSSPEGARVRLLSAVPVPETVTVKFSDGSAYRATRRWVQGNEIGFQFAEVASVDLLDAMIAGLTPDQRRALIAKIQASLLPLDDVEQ